MKNIAHQTVESKQPPWFLDSMVEYYCNRYHCKGKLCNECRELLAFERKRTENCDSCSNDSGCSRQCYPVSMRLQIDHIVRWAEPKMRWRKLFLRFRHLFAKG